MGRRIPLADDVYVQPSALSLSLLLAGIAAAIAISTTTTLCIARFRRRSNQKPSKMSPPNKIAENLDATPSPSPPPTTLITTSEALITMPTLSGVESEGGPKEEDAPIQTKELPLPPARQLRETYSCNNFVTKSASTRSLRNGSTRSLRKTMSMMKMRKSLSSVTMKRESGEDRSINHRKKKGKTKHEDSMIWKKTIILGEKCKVPDEGDEDVIDVHDEKGNRVLTYHPRTPSSISFSRQTSCIDDQRINAISFLDRDKGPTRKEEEEFS